MISLATRLRRAWAAWQAIRDHKRLMALAGSTPFDLADLLAADARLRSLPDRRPWWRDRASRWVDVRRSYPRIFFRLEWKLADLWIGAFYRTERGSRFHWNPDTGDVSSKPDQILRLDLWICLLPCLPVHARIVRRINY